MLVSNKQILNHIWITNLVGGGSSYNHLKKNFAPQINESPFVVAFVWSEELRRIQLQNAVGAVKEIYN